MTPTESVALARYIAAHFPQQPTDEFTADALGELLADFNFADCRTAVLGIAKRGERWCAPTDVLGEVKRIRSRRIDEHPPIVPPDGLTEAQERAWLAEARRRIGNGEQIDNARGELKPRNLRELTSAARTIEEDS